MIQRCITACFFVLIVSSLQAQVEPGPYRILPFEEAYIFEAFYDLENPGSMRADWTGWRGNYWESPNAYNNHRGTDFSLQTGTPIYAPADGVVTYVVNTIPENNHTIGDGYGNNVIIRHSDEGYFSTTLESRFAHLLPNVVAAVGDTVEEGDLIAYSDNTGNSTSEHLHFESRFSSADKRCPFYWGHFHYPVMFNPAGLFQAGHIIRITAETTPVKQSNSYDAQPLSTAYRDQLYFASYWRHGYYLVFIPNHQQRSAWISALDAEEVFEGYVLQAIPDEGSYNHFALLNSTYVIRNNPSESADSIGAIVWGGGRFVADSSQNGFYRIALHGGEPHYGWIKPDSQMILYTEVYNPEIELDSLPYRELPLQESFPADGEEQFWRPKFARGEIIPFSPSSPGGDGYVYFLKDDNTDYAHYETLISGKVEHRNYYVECDVYLEYKPEQASSGYERYGIFLRDDGFGGLDRSFEGKGNCYAMLYDSDDGRLRCARTANATLADFYEINNGSKIYITESGWHRLRIEAIENNLYYYLDSALLLHTTDNLHESGPFGIGYSNHFSSLPPDRGARFDNFRADTLSEPTAVQEESPAKPLQFMLHSNYPNPFNPSTTVEFSLPAPTDIVLDVFTITGEVAATLAEGWFEAGTHKATFNAGDFSAGIYFIRLQAAEKQSVIKSILLK